MKPKPNFHFRPYENIIIIFRDPILRAMSPSNEYANDLKRGILYTKQKISNEYFEKDFIEDLKTIIPAWKAWFEKLLKINAKFCLVNYDKLKTNVIEEIRPAVNFLGFEINEELEKCILTNQEGTNHRPEKSKDEILSVIRSLGRHAAPNGSRKARFDAEFGDVRSVLAHNHRIYYLVEEARIVILDVILDAEIHSVESA